MADTPDSTRFRHLIEAAILAPSSHNTQPWIFRLSTDGIELFADRTRALPVNDPDDRELVISCGAALFNLRVACVKFSIGTKITLLPKVDDPDLLAIIKFDGSTSDNHQDVKLYPAISKRRTFRKLFEEKPVPDSLPAELKSAAEREGAFLKILTTKIERKQVAELITKGDSIQWANPSWRRELAAWMHPRRKGDGLAIPWLIAPLAHAVVRTFDMGDGVGAKDIELTDKSPILASICTSANKPLDWITAGQALQHVLLLACTNGIQASYLNQPVQVTSLRIQLQNLLGITEYPQIIIRMGVVNEELKSSARRKIDEVLDI